MKNGQYKFILFYTTLLLIPPFVYADNMAPANPVHPVTKPSAGPLTNWTPKVDPSKKSPQEQVKINHEIRKKQRKLRRQYEEQKQNEKVQRQIRSQQKTIMDKVNAAQEARTKRLTKKK